MSILILFQNSKHSHTIRDLCNNYEKNGIRARSFNVALWRPCKCDIRIAFWIRLLCLFATIPGLRGIITDLFRYKALLRLCADYSVVEIHFFSSFYDKLIRELKARGNKIKITLWGSDFYRVDTYRLEQQRLIYNLVDIIQVETKQIALDFLQVFPECAEKIRIAHFGIIQLELIDKLMLRGDKEFYKNGLIIPADKIVVTCGTNGSEGHQHKIILDSIEKLDPEIKRKMFLLIPMTYGGTAEYVEQVRRQAETLSIPYLLLSKYLSLNELCQYRIASDILITIQRTDALSSAIQEHLYTGGILIAGEWLPYIALKEQQIFYLITSLQSLTETLSETLVKFSELAVKCSGNMERISDYSRWNRVIKDWANIYFEMIAY